MSERVRGKVIYVSAETHTAAKIEAVKRGETLGEMVEKLIIKELKKSKK